MRREEELASGHEEIRFAGYVTRERRDEDELDARVRARSSRPRSRRTSTFGPLWGEQDAGFVHGALPIGARTARSGSGRRLM